MTEQNSRHSIVVEDLEKSFGDLKVLKGISFSVERGTILALLGPNGAGKTTTIRILSTLLPLDSGRAVVNSYDVSTQAGDVRSNIGLTGQFAAVDIYLTGEENLLMLGRLYRLSKSDAYQRTQELIKQFDLTDAAKRPVKNYSGGMKRRLDLAMSLIATPPVIFLDEPTTGLDPRSRQSMWHLIRQLTDRGITILLTTQYMDEADSLADNVVVIDDGQVIAEGTPDELKAQVGSEHLDLTFVDSSVFAIAEKVLNEEAHQSNPDQRTITVAAKHGPKKLVQLMKLLEDNGVEVESVAMRRPTLDDVFMSLTGHGTIEDDREATVGESQ